MRITLETTVYEPEYATKAVVEKPRDDLTIWEVMDMVNGALVGFGCSPNLIIKESNERDTTGKRKEISR